METEINNVYLEMLANDKHLSSNGELQKTIDVKFELSEFYIQGFAATYRDFDGNNTDNVEYQTLVPFRIKLDNNKSEADLEKLIQNELKWYGGDSRNKEFEDIIGAYCIIEGIYKSKMVPGGKVKQLYKMEFINKDGELTSEHKEELKRIADKFMYMNRMYQ